MASKKIVLILGAGPRIGISVAEKFASNGFQVAIASRSGTGSKTANGFLSLKSDFSKPESIPSLFEKVKAEFKAAPNVIVYNAAAMTPPSDKDSLLSVPVENVMADQAVNVFSPYVAAQQAIAGWETLSQDVKKSFIYTGNISNVKIMPVPFTLTLGIGKASSGYWVGLADMMYAARGFRFFYADERFADGKVKGMEIDGEAHAEFYTQLASHEDIPSHATFVKGTGYVQFKRE